MSERILITGCEGFIGSHLADMLAEKGLETYAMVYGDTKNIRHLKDRMSKIVLGRNMEGKIITAADIKAQGAMVGSETFNKAIQKNIVDTTLPKLSDELRVKIREEIDSLVIG